MLSNASSVYVSVLRPFRRDFRRRGAEILSSLSSSFWLHPESAFVLLFGWILINSYFTDDNLPKTPESLDTFPSLFSTLASNSPVLLPIRPFMAVHAFIRSWRRGRSPKLYFSSWQFFCSLETLQTNNQHSCLTSSISSGIPDHQVTCPLFWCVRLIHAAHLSSLIGAEHCIVGIVFTSPPFLFKSARVFHNLRLRRTELWAQSRIKSFFYLFYFHSSALALLSLTGVFWRERWNRKNAHFIVNMSIFA